MYTVGLQKTINWLGSWKGSCKANFLHFTA